MPRLKRRSAAAAGAPAAPSESMYALAYNAAIETLKLQDGTLASFRNRASGLLATAALVASFSISIGIIKVAPPKVVAIPHPYGWVLLATFVLTGVASSVVLWPTRRWAYGPDPNLLLKAIENEGLTLEQLYGKFARLLTDASRRNAPKLLFRVRAYQAGIILLVIEVGTIIVAISVS